jgi:hypothetical protein
MVRPLSSFPVRLLAAVAVLLTAAPSLAQAWEGVPAMSTARSGAAWAVLDGRLYVMGGRSAGGGLLASAEVFTPGAGWAPIADLRRARADARAVVLNGAIYLLGGQEDGGACDDVDSYRPAANDWDGEDNLGAGRVGLAAGVAGGQIFVLGGAGDGGGLFASSERYVNRDWEPYPTWTLSPPRALAGSAEFEGAVVLAGGFSPFGPLDAVHRFVPGQPPSALPALPSARGRLALTSNGPSLFAVGGRDAGDVRLTAVDRLASGASGWTALTPLPEAREGAVAAVLGTDLYVVGGTGPFGSVLASAVRLPGAAVGTDDGPPTGPSSTLALDGPNPARGAVRLRYEAAEAGPARLVVVDVRGREVAVLADGVGPAGRRTAVWDASGLPAGLYAARLTTPTGGAVVRFVLVR